VVETGKTVWRDMMRALRKTLNVAYWCVIFLSTFAAFTVGAIFAETRININLEPNALTYFLAR
jgi:hypothetical protein